MKSIKIIIIVSILILLLLCGAIATIYFMTDMFKSDKEVFYKYASQMKLDEFVDTEFYTEYSDKIQTNKNMGEGSLSLKAVENGNEQEYLKINYTGKNDNQNKFSKNEFKISAQDQEILNFGVMRNNDLYGLIIDDVINKYVVIENNNLKEFAEKLGVADTSNIPDKIDFDSYSKMTEEDKQEIKNLYVKYLGIAIEQIPQDNYSKLGKTNIEVDGRTILSNGYKLSISIKDIYNMITKVGETARDDEKLFNLINKYSQEEQITFDEYKLIIDALIQELNVSSMTEEELNTEVLQITIYQKDGKAVKLEAKLGDEGIFLNASIEQINNKIILTIKIAQEGIQYGIQNQDGGPMVNAEIVVKVIKTGDKNSSNWDITISSMGNNEEQSNASLRLSRTGDINSNQIEHKATLKIIYNNTEFIVALDDKIEFVSNIDIEEFTSENHIVLNDLSNETLQQLFTQISQKIMEKIPLGQIGLYNQAETASVNTKVQVIKEEIALAKADVTLNYYSMGRSGEEPTLSDIVNKLKSDGKITDEQYQEAIEYGYITVEGTEVYILENEGINDLESQEIQTFNSQFESYAGIQSAGAIGPLMAAVENSNETNINRHVSVTGIANTPSGIKAGVNSQKQYKVSFVYENGNGYITTVKVVDVE